MKRLKAWLIARKARKDWLKQWEVYRRIVEASFRQ